MIDLLSAQRPVTEQLITDIAQDFNPYVATD